MGGLPGIDETVFFHKASGTLLVADVSFNVLELEGFVARLFMRLNDAYGRFGPSRVARSLVKDRRRCDGASIACSPGSDADRALPRRGGGDRRARGARAGVRVPACSAGIEAAGEPGVSCSGMWGEAPGFWSGASRARAAAVSQPAISVPSQDPTPIKPAFTPAALIKVMRPKQWTKNLALMAPLVFANRLFVVTDVIHAAMATAAFCLLAGCVYVFNDVGDREKDRAHPEKRNRPIASGALPVPVAIVWGALCGAGALAVAFYLSRLLFYTCTAYLVMQAAYTLRLKQVAVLDVMIIAVGFVMRVVAGAYAIAVPVSNWLYLCTLCLALFLGFCKRRTSCSCSRAAPRRTGPTCSTTARPCSTSSSAPRRP